jgi:hypothetical protein
LGSIPNRLLGGIIICRCFWRISFLLLARFEEPLSAGAVRVFMLGHVDLTRRAAQSPAAFIVRRTFHSRRLPLLGAAQTLKVR